MDRSIVTKAFCCAYCKYLLREAQHQYFCNLDNSFSRNLSLARWLLEHAVSSTDVCPFFESQG